MNDHDEDFRDKLIKHNIGVRGLKPSTLTVKDYHNVKSKKVTCDMCGKFFHYKELKRIHPLGMVCNKCYYK